jgi:hypothetical protein
MTEATGGSLGASQAEIVSGRKTGDGKRSQSTIKDRGCEKRAIEANRWLDASPGWQKAKAQVGFGFGTTIEPN